MRVAIFQKCVLVLLPKRANTREPHLANPRRKKSRALAYRIDSDGGTDLSYYITGRKRHRSLQIPHHHSQVVKIGVTKYLYKQAQSRNSLLLARKENSAGGVFGFGEKEPDRRYANAFFFFF